MTASALVSLSLAAAIAVAAPQASAQTTPAAPAQAPVDMTLASRVVPQYQLLKRHLTRMVEVMPAEHYTFRPTPEMRTFAENVAHLLSANVNQCGALIGRRHELGGQDLTKTLSTKEQLTKATTDIFAFCDEYFNALTTDAPFTSSYFSTQIRRDGQLVPVRVPHGAMITSLIGHSNEMYGYMAVYLRLKGIVPPSSEPSR
jgi:hypothetical protein